MPNPIENGLTACNSQPVKTLSKRTTDFIAICAKVKGAAAGFYIDRGIDANTILIVALALVWGVLK